MAIDSDVWRQLREAVERNYRDSLVALDKLKGVICSNEQDERTSVFDVSPFGNTQLEMIETLMSTQPDRFWRTSELASVLQIDQSAVRVVFCQQPERFEKQKQGNRSYWRRARPKANTALPGEPAVAPE